MKRNTGRLGEGLIELIFLYAEQDGACVIRQNHPSTGIDAKGRRFFKKAGSADFTGTLRGGRSFVAEAKSTTKKAWTWTEGSGRRAGTKRRQIADITAHGRLGALAGLLIYFQGLEMGSLFWVPWQGIPVVAKGSWTPTRLFEKAGGVAMFINPEAQTPVLQGALDLDHRLAYPR